MEVNLELIIAVVSVVVGLGLLVQHKRMLKLYDEIKKSVSMVYLSGFLSLIIGLLILSAQGSLWVAGLKGIIVSVLGWASVLKGVVLLIIPQMGLQLVEMKARKVTILIGGLVLVALGLILLLG